MMYSMRGREWVSLGKNRYREGQKAERREVIDRPTRPESWSRDESWYVRDRLSSEEHSCHVYARHLSRLSVGLRLSRGAAWQGAALPELSAHVPGRSNHAVAVGAAHRCRRRAGTARCFARHSVGQPPATWRAWAATGDGSRASAFDTLSHTRDRTGHQAAEIPRVRGPPDSRRRRRDLFRVPA